MSKRITVDEMLRIALIDAEVYERDLAEANRRADPVESKKAADLAEQMRKYRLKRWGKTQYEASIENATVVEVTPKGLKLPNGTYFKS